MGKLISVNEQKVFKYISEHPKCTRKEISVDLGLLKDSVKKYVNDLLARRVIKVYPTEKRPALYVIASYDINDKPAEETEETPAATESPKVSTPVAVKSVSKTEALKACTPRELMLELRSRGYMGTLKLTIVKEVNFANL